MRDTKRRQGKGLLRGSSHRGYWLACAVVFSVTFSCALSACGVQDPLAQQAAAGDRKNYIAGDGSVTEYSQDHRGQAITFSGTMLDGQVVDSSALRGSVVVLNFWYASCAPCRAEANDLEGLHREFADRGVKFLGINIRDERATAESFLRTFHVSYPSALDKNGAILMAVSSFVPPAAVPTTVVLDPEGRVSARILGKAERGTLKALLLSAGAHQETASS